MSGLEWEMYEIQKNTTMPNSLAVRAAMISTLQTMITSNEKSLKYDWRKNKSRCLEIPCLIISIKGY